MRRRIGIGLILVLAAPITACVGPGAPPPVAPPPPSPAAGGPPGTTAPPLSTEPFDVTTGAPLASSATEQLDPTTGAPLAPANAPGETPADDGTQTSQATRVAQTTAGGGAGPRDAFGLNTAGVMGLSSLPPLTLGPPRPVSRDFVELWDELGTTARSSQVIAGISPTSAVTFDTTMRGVVRAVKNAGRWRFTFIDIPLLTEQDLANVSADRSLNAFDSGDLHASWTDGRLAVSFGEGGSYGLQNTAYLGLSAPIPGAPIGLTPPPPQTLVPGNTNVLTASSTTNATIGYTPTTHWLTTLGASYILTGGGDAKSRETVAFQYGSRVDAQAIYRSKHQSFTTAASLIDSSTVASPCAYLMTAGASTAPSCAPQSDILTVLETWAHEVSKRSAFAVGGGVSAVRQRLDPDAPYPWFGTATGDVSYGFRSSSFLVRADAAYAPAINYQGLANTRATANLISALVTKRFFLTLTALAVDALATDTAPQTTSLTGRLDLEVPFTRYSAVIANGTYTWVDQNPYGPVGSWAASLGIAVFSGNIRY